MRLTAIAAISVLAVTQAVDPDEIAREFERFVKKYSKEYQTAEERLVRFKAFTDNFLYIESENEKDHLYQLGLNEFADMSSEEFSSTHLGYTKPAKVWGDVPHLGTHRYSNATLPTSVDWRTNGSVTGVKNQGQCGSCWAFSTTGSLEGAWHIATGKLVSISEQQLVDCSSSFGNQGCNGGSMDSAFKYAEGNIMCTEDSYPYLGQGGTCKGQSSCTSGIPRGGVVGFKDVTPQDLNALMEAVAQQPVSIAIEADKSAFQLYTGGLLSGDCGTTLDHGVLLVGYGTDGGKDYWIVKNSWGVAWGENGYARVLRGKNKPGECGIKLDPSYPVVTSKPGPQPPSPTPTPPPTPPPPTPPTTHYGAPPCLDDEKEGDVIRSDSSSIFNKTVCAPSCDSKACPTDVPQGAQGKPSCTLMDTKSYTRYCAITCSASISCPAAGTCVWGGAGVMICTYNKTDASVGRQLQIVPPEEEASIISV